MAIIIQVKQEDIRLSQLRPNLLGNGPIEIAITRITGRKSVLTYHEVGTQLWLMIADHSGANYCRYLLNDWMRDICLKWDNERNMVPFNFAIEL